MLITRIKASNFYGIKNSVELSFTEGGVKEKIGFTNIGKKQRASLISGFYGANASGKSTILNIISKIIGIILVNNQEGVVMALPNLSEEMKSKPIELEMDFIINKNNYQYSVSIVNEGREISKEVLDKNSKNIFVRENHSVSFKNSIKKKLTSISQNIIVPSQSSFLSIILDDSFDLSVFENIKQEIGISDLRQIQSKICIITHKGMVNVREQKEINNINAVVKYFEPSFDELIIEKSDNRFNVKYNDFYITLPLSELSAGTKEIICCIYEIINIIKNGGIFIYDETSKYYHPDIEMAILNLFRDKDINKNNAQIFFSSHNHETIDLLQNNQTHILEKKSGDIVVTKVSDFNVKKRDNIKRMYRLGSFGGIPDTIDFNRVINNIL